jgi:hypothetical protein
MIRGRAIAWLSLYLVFMPVSEAVFSPMKVIFRQSGGYASLILGCELNTSLMESREAQALQSLVERSGFSKWKTTGGYAPSAADLTNYEITVETGKGIYKIVFDDLTIPKNILPLLEYLKACAKPLPLR